MFSPVRILLDARKIEDGGIGVYTRNLIQGLLLQPDIKLTLLGDKNIISRFPWSASVGILEEDARPYSFKEIFLMGRQLSPKDFDLFHTPHFVLPYGLKIPSIVTIHDLIHLSHPEKQYYPLLAGALIKSALKRSTRILTVSKSSFFEIQKFCGFDKKVSERMRLVPNSLDPGLKKIPLDFGAALKQKDLKPNSYFLVVSSMSKPHKGVENAIEAFQKFKSGDSRQADMKLVLVGKGSEGLKMKQNFEDVLFLGEVTQVELANLYAAAFALLVPSKAEGFCLPVLEAKAFGTTVVSRPVPAILELLDEKDFVCSDFSVAAMTNAMCSCIAEREPGSEKRSGQDLNDPVFSIEQMGLSVLDIYSNALQQHSPGSEVDCEYVGRSI